MEIHLKKKHEARQSQMACAPQNIGEYIKAKVYDKEEVDGIQEEEITLSMVGKVELKDNEKAVLKLHPKFAVREDIDEEDMDFQGELGYAKLRYQLLREAEDDEGIGDEVEEGEELIELTDEEKEKLEMQEAKRRQYYDPEEKVFNNNKKRVTDLRENARVTLPRAVKEMQEAGIEIRRQNMKRIVKKFKEMDTGGNGA